MTSLKGQPPSLKWLPCPHHKEAVVQLQRPSRSPSLLHSLVRKKLAIWNRHRHAPTLRSPAQAPHRPLTMRPNFQTWPKPWSKMIKKRREKEPENPKNPEKREKPEKLVRPARPKRREKPKKLNKPENLKKQRNDA